MSTFFISPLTSNVSDSPAVHAQNVFGFGCTNSLLLRNLDTPRVDSNVQLFKVFVGKFDY